MPAAVSSTSAPDPDLIPPLYRAIVVEPTYRPARLLPALLFVLTAISTTLVGARLQYNFNLGRPPFATADDVLPFVWAWHQPGVLGLGLPFSLSLMGILLAHELGHYGACRFYRIHATYPHFLPAPTLIGTLGAFIRIRSPFRSLRQLFDVGVAGPLAGFVALLPLLWLGLHWSQPITYLPADNAMEFGWPWLARGLLPTALRGLPPQAIYLHPIARAAWIGMFATMLNLLPAGQLDGGHLLFAYFPRLHRWVSWLLVPALLLAGARFWHGWYLWAAVVASMRGGHPYVSRSQPLGTGRAWLALLALLLFVATFSLTPFILT